MTERPTVAQVIDAISFLSTHPYRESLTGMDIQFYDDALNVREIFRKEWESLDKKEAV